MKSTKVSNIILDILKFTILILGAIITVMPFVWMILSSLKTASEITAIPPTFFPKDPQWSNYQEAWSRAPFLRYFVNTIIVAVCSTLGVLITTVLSAFAFSRLNFPGKKLVFALLMATLMIPGEMLVITNYITVFNMKIDIGNIRSMGIHFVDALIIEISEFLNRYFLGINTYGALIIPWIASVFYIYLLTQFFMQVPDAIYLAAKVDKCSDWKFMWKIMVPMNKQAIVTIGILNFISSWNAFMWPLLVTNDPNMRVLSNGLTQFQSEAGSDYQLIMAASCILVMPIIIIYLFLRKYIIEGVTRSGLKG
ncbi:MAG: carbohydrate ABC transporter permease [Butyrivibrio sp.]|uniref:carbohydrate ABC transporter permease n=1 Tax=Butyrivibrio sp. TaxID=28121 RepID=UPI0025CBF206|nr:carbohydrate ABC transporter permease [Butyrivibrio sp.]MCR5769923.1 carbohydrate ABC transporter permease [Butyrivibrio sp.]